VHVPASTKATNPDDEFTVQIPVVELVYDFVPAPALADDVTVGGEAVNPYEDEYEPESIVKVRLAAVTEKLTSVAVAAAKVPPEVIVEPIVHVPASTKATTPLDKFTVQIPVVELVYDLVPDPSPVDAVATIVGGAAVNT
jgi:hypothetical protein